MTRLNEISEEWGCLLGVAMGVVALIIVAFVFGFILWVGFG